MRNTTKILLIGFLILIIVLCLLHFWPKGQVQAPAINAIKDTNNYATTSLSIGQDHITVEIADTEEKRTLGLGNRSSLPLNTGMLFIFDHPDHYGFWMKDTKIALDMIWISEDKKIVDIKSDVLPETYPMVFRPQSLALYVLELPAGYAKIHQIKTGEQVNF
ncbi:MAG TPA: DUF192 domain-containing protein [Candidatus Paceibacterota bacterium]|nr:DUF192 domain-containing protein [Candidatus Paceibacterota bacterium]